MELGAAEWNYCSKQSGHLCIRIETSVILRKTFPSQIVPVSALLQIGSLYYHTC